MALTRIVMRLARNPDAGFPDGDDKQGYVLVAPLDSEGRLDPDAWREAKEKCVVVRFTEDDDNEADGWLSRRGENWYFRYDEEDEGPDEPAFKLGDHQLRIGDYVTIHDADGDDLTYTVTDSRPL